MNQAEPLADIPHSMREARRWLVWRLIPNQTPGKKPRKVPFYVNGQPRNGVLDTPEDWARLGTFTDACNALASNQYTGLGFALGPDSTSNCWQGVDLDSITDNASLRLIGDDLPGYTETSPSGNGMHAIGYGRQFAALGSNGTGIEAYSSGRYFTVTGEEAGVGEPVDLSEFVERVLRPRHSPRPSATIHSAEVVDFATPDTLRELRSALSAMRADDRDLWIANGQRLKRLGEQGRALWLEWSQQSDKFDPADASRAWDSFSADRTGYQAIFADAQRRGWANPLSGASIGVQRPAAFVPNPTDPWWGFKFAPDLVRDIGPTRWLVRKMLPEDCTGTLYGPSGTLKSFVMIDMGLSIAHGVPWQGKQTKKRTVIYLAGEGEQGFAKRLMAWSLERNLPAPANFAFRQMPKIQSEDELSQLQSTVERIAAEYGDIGLIIIDTLFTALDGGDENSGKDMGLVISAMKRLRVAFGAAVITVHHTGKVGDTARGHSSLPSGMDVMFFSRPGPVPLSVEITNPKQKDGAEHPTILLQAAVKPLGIVGEDGETETSLVLHNPSGDLVAAKAKRTEEGEAKAPRAPGQGPKQAIALAALRELTAANQLVTESTLRQSMQERGVEKSAAWHAVKALLGTGQIVAVDGFLRIEQEGES